MWPWGCAQVNSNCGVVTGVCSCKFVPEVKVYFIFYFFVAGRGSMVQLSYMNFSQNLRGLKVTGSFRHFNSFTFLFQLTSSSSSPSFCLFPCLRYLFLSYVISCLSLLWFWFFVSCQNMCTGRRARERKKGGGGDQPWFGNGIQRSRKKIKILSMVASFQAKHWDPLIKEAIIRVWSDTQRKTPILLAFLRLHFRSVCSQPCLFGTFIGFSYFQHTSFTWCTI